MKLSGPLNRWITGGFFALSALVEFSEKALVSGIASALIAALLIQPASKAMFARIKQPVPTIARIGLGTALFFVVVATTNSSTKKSETTSQPQVQGEETSLAASPIASSESSAQPSRTSETSMQEATLLRVHS